MKLTPHSAVSLVNRSIDSFKDIISDITVQHYSQVCKDLQGLIQGLYEYLLFNRHNGQNVEYRVANDDGFWIERMNLQEFCHGTPSLSVIMDTSLVAAGRKTEYPPVPYKKAIVRLKNYLSGSDCCHLLFHERVKQFALESSKLLSSTHDLELEVMDGVLYFKATPYEGLGTITIISRSQDAVIENDNQNLTRLHEMGCKASFENVGLIH